MTQGIQMRSHIAAFVSVVALTACSGSGLPSAELGKMQSDIQLVKTANELQRADIVKLAERLSSLESARLMQSDTAYLDPAGGSGYQYIQTNVTPVLLSFVESSPIGDGTKIRLQVGNLSNATLSGLGLTVRYNKRMPATGAGVEEWNRTLMSTDASDPKDIPAGSWANVDISLPGIKPDELGYLAVKVNLDVLSLRRPQ